MNTLAAASLALAAALAASFTPAAAAADIPSGHAVLVVSCGAGNRPGLGAVAGLLGSNNAHEVYTARNRLMAQVRSACHKAGIERVALVGRKSESMVAVEPVAPASGPIAGN